MLHLWPGRSPSPILSRRPGCVDAVDLRGRGEAPTLHAGHLLGAGGGRDPDNPSTGDEQRHAGAPGHTPSSPALSTPALSTPHPTGPFHLPPENETRDSPAGPAPGNLGTGTDPAELSPDWLVPPRLAAITTPPRPTMGPPLDRRAPRGSRRVSLEVPAEVGDDQLDLRRGRGEDGPLVLPLPPSPTSGPNALETGYLLDLEEPDEGPSTSRAAAEALRSFRDPDKVPGLVTSSEGRGGPKVKVRVHPHTSKK